MSMITFDRPTSVGETLRVLPDFLGKVAAGAKGYISKTQTVHQLESLDNRLLMDIGLKRSEIQKMVWGGQR